ncbi:MAG: phospholipase D-like domain-containing protein [Simkaniaceae bacterium]
MFKTLTLRWGLLLFPLFFFFLIFYALRIHFPNEKVPIRFYANQTRDNLKLLTAESLRLTKNSIHLASYHLTDEDIINHLNHLAHDKDVTLYLDHTNKRIKKKLHPNITLHLIKMKGLMHEKICIIDKKYSFLGSANMTRDSLSFHDNIICGILSASLAEKLILHLKSLTENLQTPPLIERINGQKIKILFSPLSGEEAANLIKKGIQKAEQEIFISMFTFTHRPIIHLLLEERKKGKNVDVYLDQTTSRGSSKWAKEHLNPSLNRSSSLFHHKWVLLDQKKIIFGSANWTQGAFKRNADYVCQISPLTPKQKKFFKKISKKIKQETHIPNKNKT